MEFTPMGFEKNLARFLSSQADYYRKVGEWKLIHGRKVLAYLVNAARGEIINKHAFIQAFKERWTPGAAIDVFWGHPTEDVAAENDELWDIDNLFITAHNATGTDRYDSSPDPQGPNFCVSDISLYQEI